MGIKRVALWVSRPYQKDEIFNRESVLNRDNFAASFRELQATIIGWGGSCHTQDMYINEGVVPDLVIFLDIPRNSVDDILGNWKSKVRKWVILQECEVILPRNFDLQRHNEFTKIFTWHDRLIDNSKYIKLNFSHEFKMPIVNLKKEKLVTLIAGNKRTNHELELYSKRIEAIRWFEKYHIDDFNLYGVGWDHYRFQNVFPLKVLNKIKPLTKLLAPKFPSYKGTVLEKRSVLAKYKYAICYENAKDIPGYITEKIFDCFFSGCVPVYWGANNISEHIPQECYISKNEFANYNELYEFMKHLDERAYLNYLLKAQEFLVSEKSKQFRSRCFADRILEEIKSVQ
ncbi:MAG: hypothetical protein H6Q73_1731 [Firmicutes bacterium]|nr:hypothetical protein [Bacillota bacterium]